MRQPLYKACMKSFILFLLVSAPVFAGESGSLSTDVIQKAVQNSLQDAITVTVKKTVVTTRMEGCWGQPARPVRVEKEISVVEQQPKPIGLVENLDNGKIQIVVKGKTYENTTDAERDIKNLIYKFKDDGKTRAVFLNGRFWLTKYIASLISGNSKENVAFIYENEEGKQYVKLFDRDIKDESEFEKIRTDKSITFRMSNGDRAEFHDGRWIVSTQSAAN